MTTINKTPEWLDSPQYKPFCQSLLKQWTYLRKNTRQTIDTENPHVTEFPVNDHFTIEAYVGGQWILLKVPDGTVFYDDYRTRDLVFDRLPSVLTGNVKQVRAEIIEFVKSKGGRADRTEIKAHFQMDEFQCYPVLDQALKTTKLIPIYGDGYIGSGYYLSRRPIIAYELSS